MDLFDMGSSLNTTCLAPWALPLPRRRPRDSNCVEHFESSIFHLGDLIAGIPFQRAASGQGRPDREFKYDKMCRNGFNNDRT